MDLPLNYVCFAPVSGYAIVLIPPRNRGTILDEQRLRHGDAQRFRRLEVNAADEIAAGYRKAFFRKSIISRMT